MWKNIFLVGVAVLSALYTASTLVIDAQGWFPDIPWQYQALGGFIIYLVFTIWIIWDKQWTRHREIEPLLEVR